MKITKQGITEFCIIFRDCDRTEEEQISETLDLKRKGVSFSCIK